MRIVEIRRHAMRLRDGEHLSQRGIDLARQVGCAIGSFDRVITSTLPRAIETAIAMGFALDETMEELSTLGEDVSEEIAWDAGFAEFARVIGIGGATARFAERQCGLWMSIAESLPERGRALIITHGGMIEAGAVALFPGADHDCWGEPFDYCEGARLSFNGGRFTGLDLLRVTRE